MLCIHMIGTCSMAHQVISVYTAFVPLARCSTSPRLKIELLYIRYYYSVIGHFRATYYVLSSHIYKSYIDNI
jgi:hypothetical protein